MKKLTLVIARNEIDDLLQTLMRLACLEVSAPEAPAGAPELQDAAIIEDYDVSHLDANKETLPLLVTRNTYILTGWVPVKSAPSLPPYLGRFVSSWEIEDLTPDESALAPVKLFFPGFFRRMRLAGRKQFYPLAHKGD